MSTESTSDAAIHQQTGTVPSLRRPPVELHSGDHMSQEEFHRLYEQTPEGFKAELIGGIVYVASPVTSSHGDPHAALCGVFVAYARETPGVRPSDNSTVILGDEGEPQPDASLRILPEYGGQTSIAKSTYIEGAPELIAEIAYSSHAIDLQTKKNDYARYGVREYLVLCVKEQQLRWFDLSADKELQPDEQGIYRIGVFPGLWVNGPALVALDYQGLFDTLQQGLATPEHAAFVKELEQRRKQAK